MSPKNSIPAIAIAVAASIWSQPSVAAFEDFCVNSLALDGTISTANYNTLVTGANGCSAGGVDGFTADRLNGGYTEILVVTPTADDGIFNFSSTVYVSWGQYFRNSGSGAIIGASTLLENQYDLYSIVRASGTLSGGTFSATDASLELWADQFSAMGGLITEQSDIMGVPQWDAMLNPILNGSGDDELLLTGDFLGGFGTASAPGRFTFMFDGIELTELGALYFIAPRPFSLNVLSDGDVDTEGFSVTGPGMFNLVGDVSANFYVPEPSSIFLTGLALIGLGIGRRRKTC